MRQPEGALERRAEEVGRWEHLSFSAFEEVTLTEPNQSTRTKKKSRKTKSNNQRRLFERYTEEVLKAKK